MLSENDNFNRDKLKAYLEAVEGGTYASRKEKRFGSIADQEKFVMGNLTKNGFGTNTLMSQLGRDTTEEQPTETMAPTGTQAVAPVPPEMAEDTTTTKLPSFEEIFGGQLDDRNYETLDREDKVALRNRALSEFNALFKDEISGSISITPSVKARYDKLTKLQKDRISVNEFAFQDYFNNRFLPDNNYTSKKTIPADILDAKQLINQYRAAGDEDTVKVIKQRLIDAGYDIRDYNL